MKKLFKVLICLFACITLLVGASACSRNEKKYTITFDPDGGEASFLTKRISFGEAVGELPETTREGYLLVCWYYEYADVKTVITSETVYNYRVSHSQ